jgi:hypothetical protein
VLAEVQHSIDSGQCVKPLEGEKTTALISNFHRDVCAAPRKNLRIAQEFNFAFHLKPLDTHMPLQACSFQTAGH